VTLGYQQDHRTKSQETEAQLSIVTRRFFSPRTLEDWYYAHRRGGFSRLQGRQRSDAGELRALQPRVAEAILELRK
jgi:hypothetical protein